MAQKEDYYKVLGVSKDADEKQLKSAFRKAAMKLHPDKNPDDADAQKKFQYLNEAYEVLKDPQKRAAYDQFGHSAFEGGGAGAGGFSGAGGFGGFDFGGSFSDIFEEMFGMGSSSRRRQKRGPTVIKGNDLQYTMDLTLEEAFNGVKKDIKIRTKVSCSACDGTGSSSKKKPTACSDCGGSGQTLFQQGFLTIQRTCPKCQGTGETVSDPCPKCSGSGQKSELKEITISIPKGVPEGVRIHSSGNGEVGPRGGPAGDLFILIRYKKHKHFEVDGYNLYLRVPIPITVASLGGEIAIPTIEGEEHSLSINPGVQTGQKYRLANKGMSIHNASNRGDLIVEIVVKTPTNLTNKEKELLMQFAEISGDKVSSGEESLIGRVKRIWNDLKE